MAEPVSLWVKTKAEAARGGQADTRLRTLRDGFGPHVPEEEVMLQLLEEELRAYREMLGDTAQERYNTLCDLLDICHEDSDRTHRRAVYLYKMAQVVCFQDFSEQTDCSAVDFTLESIRLLDEEPETAENADCLSDDKAQASLWLYVCTLEKNLHEAMEVDKRLCEAREQQNRCLEPVGTNDMDYEDKQKQQECQLIYEGLRFNLIAESKQCQPLDRALELWKDLLRRKMEPAVRSAKQTVFSVVLMAALYKLIGKPLRALESHQLAAGLARRIGDSSSYASSLCHSARLLLELGAPELAQLEQVDQLLSSMDSCAEGVLPLRVLATLLRAELCYSTRQVENGVSHLSQVLKEVGEQRCSKTWYLLRAKALQTASAYLNLNAAALPSHLRQRLTEHGLKTPDTTLYEGLKLLCSLVVTLLGNGLYGANVAVDTRFIDQGDNIILKWQLLAEVLSCSLRMVTVRSYSGAIHEAKVQCLEALKLATKLHTLSRCAEFLVVKAELELQKGEMELSGMDLEQVTSLLDLCIGWCFFFCRAKFMVFHPRKGRPAKKPQSPQAVEDEYSGLLKTRSFHQQPVDTAEEWAQAASPKLKPKRQCWLASLEHKADCSCPCCSDPGLGRVCARWAAIQAELASHSPQGATGQSHKLFLTALSRCRNVTAKVAAKLAKMMAAKDKPSLSLLDDLIGRIYMRMTLSGLQVQKAVGMWELLDSGFAFVTSKISPEMDSVQASLQVTKALAIMLTLASQKNCPSEELFSPVWPWNPLKSNNKPRMLPSKKTKDLSLFSKAEESKKKDKGVSLTAEESKKTKDTVVPSVLSKAKMTLPSTKSKDVWVDRERDGLGDFRRAGHSWALSPQSSIPASVPGKVQGLRDTVGSCVWEKENFCMHTKPVLQTDGLTLEYARDLLWSALLSLQHFPPAGLYTKLCGLLALCLGQGDPMTTAMLHSQSLGLTSRHHMTRHLTSRASAPDLAEELESLNLDDPSGHATLTHRLTQLDWGERCSAYPELSTGVTLCLLSVVGMRPGEMGDTVLLTRLERGLNPVTIRIPTAQREVCEMDSVQKQQKVVSSVADKAQWWEGRRALDSRVEKLLSEMREMLSCWMGLLLPLSPDPEVSHQAKGLHQTLTECGAPITEELLKVCVLYSHMYLQKLPWESISCLRSCSVTRMPSLQFLIGHSVSKEMDADSLLNRGVDPKKVFYVLNPDANLTDSEGRFREWFTKEPGWAGVCGAAPNPVQLQEAMTTKDLYIYVGHGAGARFLEGQRILKEELRAASFLFGCSSAALAVHGELEGSGIILNYLMAGCPMILGNLWDVTDRDIDRFTRALLQSWLSAGRGAALLDHMSSSRQATHLKHLIGAAPVVYGLPIFLR
uniref:separase n=1 Tax=Paramormyrops kingsleyae TaxID=1676925 RepID=A0A3B3QMZ6_9TELE